MTCRSCSRRRVHAALCIAAACPYAHSPHSESSHRAVRCDLRAASPLQPFMMRRRGIGRTQRGAPSDLLQVTNVVFGSRA